MTHWPLKVASRNNRLAAAVIIASGLALFLSVPPASAGDWKQKASLPEKHPFPHESPVSVGGRLYCVGNTNQEVLEYDAQVDRWRYTGAYMAHRPPWASVM